MPKIQMNYSRTKFYKIVCRDLTITETYVGHTTNWTKRKYQHKHNCCNENSKIYNLRVYTFIRENGNFDNWDMILIEEYSCENKLQAKQRERYWIKTLNATLNTNIPSRTKNEWKEENKELILQQSEQYREQNREMINEKKKEKITCECGSSIARAHLARHRQSKKHQDFIG
jgi:hypothetical protein